jgi:hypothetical protein
MKIISKTTNNGIDIDLDLGLSIFGLKFSAGVATGGLDALFIDNLDSPLIPTGYYMRQFAKDSNSSTGRLDLTQTNALRLEAFSGTQGTVKGKVEGKVILEAKAEAGAQIKTTTFTGEDSYTLKVGSKGSASAGVGARASAEGMMRFTLLRASSLGVCAKNREPSGVENLEGIRNSSAIKNKDGRATLRRLLNAYNLMLDDKFRLPECREESNFEYASTYVTILRVYAAKLDDAAFFNIKFVSEKMKASPSTPILKTRLETLEMVPQLLESAAAGLGGSGAHLGLLQYKLAAGISSFAEANAAITQGIRSLEASVSAELGIKGEKNVSRVHRQKPVSYIYTSGNGNCSLYGF